MNVKSKGEWNHNNLPSKGKSYFLLVVCGLLLKFSYKTLNEGAIINYGSCLILILARHTRDGRAIKIYSNHTTLELRHTTTPLLRPLLYGPSKIPHIFLSENPLIEPPVNTKFYDQRLKNGSSRHLTRGVSCYGTETGYCFWHYMYSVLFSCNELLL